MPAGLPGDTLANNQGNPNAGRFVTFSLMSGPKNSPLDARKPQYANGGTLVNDPNNISTGGLSTGIGFGASNVPSHIGVTAPASIQRAGFTDDYTPGVTKPDGTASANSTIMHIGGGRSIITSGFPPAGQAGCNPYTAGWGIGGAGNGGSRDAGAGPAFTGFLTKMVTNPGTAAIANAGTIEAGFVNRSGGSLAVGGSMFGSSVAASAAPA